MAKLYPVQNALTCGLDLHAVAHRAELAGGQVGVGASKVEVYQLADKLGAVLLLPYLELNQIFFILCRVAEAIDARYGCNYYHILARQERLGGGVAQALNLLVDLRLLLYIRIAMRNVGLRLVVVVVGDKVVHRRIGEELAILLRELGGERFVVGDHQRGALDRLYHIGCGKSLARAGDAEQGLVSLTALEPRHKRRNSLGLIACGLVRSFELKLHKRLILSQIGVLWSWKSNEAADV